MRNELSCNLLVGTILILFFVSSCFSDTETFSQKKSESVIKKIPYQKLSKESSFYALVQSDNSIFLETKESIDSFSISIKSESLVISDFKDKEGKYSYILIRKFPNLQSCQIYCENFIEFIGKKDIIPISKENFRTFLANEMIFDEYEEFYSTEIKK